MSNADINEHPNTHILVRVYNIRNGTTMLNNDDDRQAFQDVNRLRGWPVEAHYTPIGWDAHNICLLYP